MSRKMRTVPYSCENRSIASQFWLVDSSESQWRSSPRNVFLTKTACTHSAWSSLEKNISDQALSLIACTIKASKNVSIWNKRWMTDPSKTLEWHHWETEKSWNHARQAHHFGERFHPCKPKVTFRQLQMVKALPSQHRKMQKDCWKPYSPH